MHGLHNISYFEIGKHSCNIFIVFVRGNLSTQYFFSFSADFSTVSFFGYCSALDTAGVLNPLEYGPTWTACARNLIQVPGKRWQLVIMSSMYDHYIWLLRFDINQKRRVAFLFVKTFEIRGINVSRERTFPIVCL